jgi:hypothetical protein
MSVGLSRRRLRGRAVLAPRLSERGGGVPRSAAASNGAGPAMFAAREAKALQGKDGIELLSACDARPALAKPSASLKRPDGIMRVSYFTRGRNVLPNSKTGLHEGGPMLRSKLNYAAVILAFVLVTAADAQNADRFRNALSGLRGESICPDSPLLARWCANLGVQTAYWIDKGVSLGIDRHFDQKDQAFANNTGLTICYIDHHCIHPQ